MRRPCAPLLADEILFVVTPEMTALADTYVQLKLILRRSRDPRMGLVVNMAESARRGDRNPGWVRPARGGVPRSED